MRAFSSSLPLLRGLVAFPHSLPPPPFHSETPPGEGSSAADKQSNIKVRSSSSPCAILCSAFFRRIFAIYPQGQFPLNGDRRRRRAFSDSCGVKRPSPNLVTRLEKAPRSFKEDTELFLEGKVSLEICAITAWPKSKKCQNVAQYHTELSRRRAFACLLLLLSPSLEQQLAHPVVSSSESERIAQSAAIGANYKERKTFSLVNSSL